MHTYIHYLMSETRYVVAKNITNRDVIRYPVSGFYKVQPKFYRHSKPLTAHAEDEYNTMSYTWL